MTSHFAALLRFCWLVAIAGALAPPIAAAQANSAAAVAGKFARLSVERCTGIPRLEAVSGGGAQVLRPGEPIRIPYGVPYRFLHRLGPETDFVQLTLAADGAVQETVEAVAGTADPTCYTVLIPPLPVDRAITLVEQVGSFPSEERQAAARGEVEQIRERFIRRLYEGVYNDAILRQELRRAVAADLPALFDTTVVAGLVVREETSLNRLSTRIPELFLGRIVDLADAPARIELLQALALNLPAIAAGVSGCPNLTDPERGQVALLGRRIARLNQVATPEAIAELYPAVLPVESSLVQPVVAIIETRCAGLNPDRLADLREALQWLGQDELGQVLSALEAARLLTEQSFILTATEVFPGATTTLQRYGQLDVVNAYFAGREEVRLLAAFSFYPFATRYGAEIQPHQLEDRVLLNLGYSIATAVSDSTGVERDREVFTIGAGFRLNPYFSIGVGRWLDGREGDFYYSFSGDLGGVPFLRELLARQPPE